MLVTEAHRQELSKSLLRYHKTKQKQDPRITQMRKIWLSMKSRCLNTKNPAYYRYGGRGITVCKRWLNFDNFIEDVGFKPLGKSLDRIDNNKGYSPQNCKWSTAKEQALNRRNTRLFTYNGKTMTLSDWSRYLGVPKSRLSMRYHYGWSTERIFS